MIFLRVTRDRRGYENTYLFHTSYHEGNSKTRILYCYRTAPGVRIGRPPFGPETMRLIEENNKDLKFDWPEILKARPALKRETKTKPETKVRKRRRKASAINRDDTGHEGKQFDGASVDQISNDVTSELSASTVSSGGVLDVPNDRVE